MTQERRGSIIIAAHNEESVIGRTLDALADLTSEDGISVIVVCNGCTDGTAAIVRGYASVTLVEREVASKVGALRAGDRLASPGPRIYLDADVVLTARAARAVISALSDGAIAGRPPHRFDTRGASWTVRRWYRVRQELPSIATALWGAGCYALSRTARARFAEFPDIVSDDLFVHSLVGPDEVTIVATDPVVVTTPRTIDGLVRILRRSYRTQREVNSPADGLSVGQRGQLRDLKDLVSRHPGMALDVAVYAVVIAYARMRVRLSRGPVQWERDSSSRVVG